MVPRHLGFLVMKFENDFSLLKYPGGLLAQNHVRWILFKELFKEPCKCIVWECLLWYVCILSGRCDLYFIYLKQLKTIATFLPFSPHTAHCCTVWIHSRSLTRPLTPSRRTPTPVLLLILTRHQHSGLRNFSSRCCNMRPKASSWVSAGELCSGRTLLCRRETWMQRENL